MVLCDLNLQSLEVLYRGGGSGSPSSPTQAPVASNVLRLLPARAVPRQHEPARRDPAAFPASRRTPDTERLRVGAGD
jgi:hypothetical protein